MAGDVGHQHGKSARRGRRGIDARCRTASDGGADRVDYSPHREAASWCEFHLVQRGGFWCHRSGGVSCRDLPPQSQKGFGLMRLTAFQSDKGDCLLLTNTAGTTRILVDGGMPASYDAHVAAAMGKLQVAKKTLDIVYVSHIDQDHIGGVLKMLDDEAEWRVHEFQKKNNNPNSKVPTVPRPPK